MKAIGSLLKGAGGVVFAITGLWGLLLCIAVVKQVAGFFGTVAALFLFPITFVAAPFYAGFALGDWFPFAVNYGGAAAAMALLGVGHALNSD